MEKFQKYYLSLLILVIYSNLQAQVNCNTIEGEKCKESCEISNTAGKYQGFSVSQEALDKAIELCPTNDYAIWEKSIPFLKRGDFVTWKKLIDKAVELNPKMHLGYRAWCRYQFLRDYEGALQDFEDYDKLWNGNVGYSVNSDYHLNIAKGICLSAIGKKQEAIKVFENQIKAKGYQPGFYDYYQLGVTYFEVGNYDKALENFERQSKEYDFAENIYFKAKVSKIRNKDYLDLKRLSLKTYDEGHYMKDPYTHHYNKVYRKQIEQL